MVSHGCDFKIVAQPGCCLFSSLLLSRSGQAGLRVVTYLKTIILENQLIKKSVMYARVMYNFRYSVCSRNEF